MKENRKNLFVVALIASCAVFSLSPLAHAGGVGFTYGIGYQNIPTARLGYVTHPTVYPEVDKATTLGFVNRPVSQTQMLVASTQSNENSIGGQSATRSLPRLTPKKELLPLTGPKLN